MLMAKCREQGNNTMFSEENCFFNRKINVITYSNKTCRLFANFDKIFTLWETVANIMTISVKYTLFSRADMQVGVFV